MWPVVVKWSECGVREIVSYTFYAIFRHTCDGECLCSGQEPMDVSSSWRAVLFGSWR